MKRQSSTHTGNSYGIAHILLQVAILTVGIRVSFMLEGLWSVLLCLLVLLNFALLALGVCILWSVRDDI